MACFQRGELLWQPLPSSTSLRRRYFLSSLLSAYKIPMSGLRAPSIDRAAATVPLEFDVPASLMSADKTVDRNLDGCVLPWRALDLR